MARNINRTKSDVTNQQQITSSLAITSNSKRIIHTLSFHILSPNTPATKTSKLGCKCPRPKTTVDITKVANAQLLVNKVNGINLQSNHKTCTPATNHNTHTQGHCATWPRGVKVTTNVLLAYYQSRYRQSINKQRARASCCMQLHGGMPCKDKQKAIYLTNSLS